MMKFLRSILALCLALLFTVSAFSQTVNFEVGNGSNAAMYSGSGSDCSDCSGPPDAYFDIRFGYNNATFGTTWNMRNNNVNCDDYRQINGTASLFSATGISPTATITVQMNAWESDGFTCSSDDGNCGSLATIANSQVINSISPCGWSGQISNTRDNCASDGSTNDYRVRWYYRWCWNGVSGLSGGTVSGPDQTICSGGDPAAFSSTAAPSALYSAIQWEQSTTSATSGFSAASGTNNGLTYDPPALTTTTYYRRRVDYCINYSSNAVGSQYSNVITITVVADPSAPTATQSPGATVCTGATISLTSPTNTAGGTGTPTYWYATSSNSGGSYSAFTSTSPSQTASAVSSGQYREQIYVAWSGLGCDNSPTTTYNWDVVADPTTPTPAAQDICSGYAPVFTSVPSGGTGSLNSQWQYSANGSTGWANVATSTPTSWSYSGATTTSLTVNTNPTALAGTYYYRNVVTNSLGCDVTSGNAVLNVYADPAAPTATRNPNLGTVCLGAALSLASPTLTSGGIGTYSFEYSYTTDNVSFTSYSSTLPTFNPAVGSNNKMYIRVVYSGNGCDASPANNYSWTAVADPLLTSPSSSTICVGGSTTFSSTASGGTGTYNHSWEYSANGSTGWATVSNGTPTGYTYSSSGTTSSTGTLTVTTSGSASPGTAYFRDNFTTITSPVGGSCDAISTNGTLTVVSDPNLSDPGSIAICKGGSTTLSTTASGGTGTFTYTWQYYNGSTWATVANNIPTGVTYTASTNTLGIATNNSTTPAGSYQYRCVLATNTPSGAGCDAISPTSTVTVSADPTLSAPASSTICKGGSANPTSTVSGGAGTFNLQWNYYNGSSWVAVADGTPTGVTYTGSTSNSLTVNTDNSTTPAGNYQYQMVLTSNTPSGGGCDATSATSTITVVNDPAAPTATKNPNVSTVCAGAPLTLASITGGGGGTGTCNFETRYSTDNGGTWSGWVTGASPTPFTAVTGTNLMEVRQNCGGSGCDISNATQYSWTVVNDPAAPTATQSPSAATVCAGATLTVTSPTAGSGGTGTCNIEYRYSTNNGSTYTSWSTSVPSFSAVAGGNNYIEMRMNCNGSGCDISSTTQYVWNVVADPVVSISPNLTQQCGSIIQTLNANVTGGTGTPTYAWEWDQSTGSWTSTGTNSSSLSISLTTPATYLYRVTYSTTGDGCDANLSANATMTVRDIPALSVTSDNCSYNAGSNQEYVVNTVSGGTPPYTYTTTPGSAVQRYLSANGSVGVFRLPAVATSYNFVVRDFYNCSTSGSVTPTSTIPSNIPIPGGSGSYTYAADCESRALNEWEHYKQIGDNNNVLVSVNDQGVDLGTVSVSCYVNDTTPFLDKTCQGVTFKTYGMRRHFVLTSSSYPNGATFPTNVKVRLYFTQAETNDLSSKSLAGTANGCADDDDFTDPTGLTDLFVTKYTGTNEDDKYWNNSSGGIYKVYGPITTNSAYAGPLTVSPGGFASAISGSNSHNYVELSVDRFSEFWMNGAEHGQALPVKMLFFDAKAVDNKLVRLSWATATEIDNSGFDVERSSNGVDFTKIGFVNGNGNSSHRIDYTFDDGKVTSDITYYYRLKQVDIDGHFEYSGMVSAHLNGDHVFTVSEFIPNPATNTTRLDIYSSASQDVVVRVYNVMGQEVATVSEVLQHGYNAVQLNTANLPAGTYTADIITNGTKLNRRVIITR
ncbi:MAG: T9SS type A sorting domain-containing protein [Chitinophagales bacterium]